MREIKFRVYCEFEFDGQLYKEMAEPSNWFLLSQTGKLMTHEPTGAFNPNAEKDYKKLIALFFTGLKDKQGKEIYEGDITECKEIIVFEGGAFCLSGPSECYGRPFLIEEDAMGVTVIGNIYENPELIKEADNGKV